MNFLSTQQLPDLPLRNIQASPWQKKEEESKEGFKQTSIVTLNYQNGSSRQVEFCVQGKDQSEIADLKITAEMSYANNNVLKFIESANYMRRMFRNEFSARVITSEPIKAAPTILQVGNFQQKKLFVTRHLLPIKSSGGNYYAAIIKGSSLEEVQKVCDRIDALYLSLDKSNPEFLNKFQNACSYIHKLFNIEGKVEWVSCPKDRVDFIAKSVSFQFSAAYRDKIVQYEIITSNSNVKRKVDNYLNSVFVKNKDLNALTQFVKQCQNEDPSIIFKRCNYTYDKRNLLSPEWQPNPIKKRIRIFDGLSPSDRLKNRSPTPPSPVSAAGSGA